MNEHEIQNDIRSFLNYLNGEFWRINVGAGYLSRNPNLPGRWFSTGVPKGFPDLIGIMPRRIERGDMGKTIGQFVFLEIKSGRGKLSIDQQIFHDSLKHMGAAGGIARSIDDVKSLIGVKNEC